MSTYKWPQRFAILRNNNPVAYGVQFDDGRCVVNCVGKFRSIIIWNSIDEVKASNRENGDTLIQIS